MRGLEVVSVVAVLLSYGHIWTVNGCENKHMVENVGDKIKEECPVLDSVTFNQTTSVWAYLAPPSDILNIEVYYNGFNSENFRLSNTHIMRNRKAMDSTETQIEPNRIDPHGTETHAESNRKAMNSTGTHNVPNNKDPHRTETPNLPVIIPEGWNILTFTPNGQQLAITLGGSSNVQLYNGQLSLPITRVILHPEVTTCSTSYPMWTLGAGQLVQVPLQISVHREGHLQQLNITGGPAYITLPHRPTVPLHSTNTSLLVNVTFCEANAVITVINYSSGSREAVDATSVPMGTRLTVLVGSHVGNLTVTLNPTHQQPPPHKELNYPPVWPDDNTNTGQNTAPSTANDVLSVIACVLITLCISCMCIGLCCYCNVPKSAPISTNYVSWERGKRLQAVHDLFIHRPPSLGWH